MATHELVVPRSIPITGPETLEELKRALRKEGEERDLRGPAMAREDLAVQEESRAAENISKCY
jgi:hypothetical protein